MDGIFEFILPLLEGVPAVRAILGFILIFLLPGSTWTLVFFKKINVLERAALSFGLSIAIVTLSVLALNILLDIRVNGLNALLIIIVVTIIPVAFYYLKRFMLEKGSRQRN